MEKNELPCWAALAIIAGVVLFGIFLWQWPTNQSEWAAWVQAFGVIGSIIGAFAIATRQARASMVQAEQIAKADIARKQEAYKAVVQVAHEYAKSTGELVLKRPPACVINAYWRTMGEEDTRAAVEALMALPLHDLGNSELVVAANGVRSSLTKMRYHVGEFVTATEASPDSYPPITESIQLQMSLASHYWDNYEGSYKSL